MASGGLRRSVTRGIPTILPDGRIAFEDEVYATASAPGGAAYGNTVNG